MTTLLQSRTVDLPVEDKGKRSEVKVSEPPDHCDKQAVIANNPVQQNEIDSHRFLEAVSTSSRVGNHVHFPSFFWLIFELLEK